MSPQEENERRKIFSSPRDYKKFLSYLMDAVGKHGAILHALVLEEGAMPVLFGNCCEDHGFQKMREMGERGILKHIKERGSTNR